jgi:Tol biopolymer transport system component
MRIRSTQRLTAGAEFRATPVLSRDGKRLAYTMAKGTVRLWTFPFDSANGRVAGDGQPVTEGGLNVRTWSLSYDGTRLAYVADRAGTTKMELWMTDLTRGKHGQLTDDDQARVTPQWSRDGAMLAYGWFERAADEKSRQALAIRRIESQEEQLISTPLVVAGWAVAPFDWSLDGRWILASSVLPHPPVHSLTLWPLAGASRAETAIRTLAYDPNYDLWQARYSPDGKWICFVAGEREASGGNTIFVMPSAGADRSQWTPLTDSREWADKPRWSPDGKLVYFIRYRSSFFNLWAVQFDGTAGKPVGEPFQITWFQTPTRQISTDLANAEIGVSPNRLILTILEQVGNIWVLDNVDQ